MAIGELLGKQYSVPDFECADHQEAADSVARQVQQAIDSKEFGRILPKTWDKVATCRSGRHKIIVRMNSGSVNQFTSYEREYPMGRSDRIR